MPETFRPLGDRVLVRPLKPKPREDLLLDTGDAGKEDEVLRGEVLRTHVIVNEVAAPHSRGDVVRYEIGSCPVKVGETICYAQYSGRNHKLNGEELLILTEEEILGVIENV